IFFGDAMLWCLGRFVGRRAIHWPKVREWLPEHALDRWGRLFDQHAVKAVFVARAIPGTRVPTYIAAGLLSKRAHRFLFWAALAALLWTPILLILAILIGPPIKDFFEGIFGGPVALIAAFITVFMIFRVITLSTTRIGRIRLQTWTVKPQRVEFWPPWIYYIPLGPYLLYLAARKGPMTFTCVNPGIPHGGGVVGESKHLILRALENGAASEFIVATELIEAGLTPEVRATLVDELVRDNPRFGGYPVILKPDESQRGHAFKVIHNEEDARNYFVDMTRPALLQAYHPGPHEIGVLWSRVPGPGFDGAGEIFSITKKVFPVIEGDGVHTLEQLIWRHPRYRMQARTVLKRFIDQTDLVLPHGERKRLAVAGNHCQGTMFLDGADLITEPLRQRIDELARSFKDDALDFGRFDIRYESEEDLRRGENFAIVELNGAMSESTNLYDPHRSIAWSYGVLFRQWRRLYELGAQRRRNGVRPMRWMELVHAIRDHYRGRPGSSVSD
ncbi:MAG: VTT domain-containing protein, partial [Planctomycetota bacterium]|nr:VTT domain-containing protein [Planctomycetota bacterium]